MNRIVLIGNGFDLAHGLKTSYADFINWYWEQWMNKILFSLFGLDESDGLCSVRITNYHIPKNTYLNGLDYINALENNPNIFFNKGVLIQEIMKDFENSNWVDIESVYYRLLCESMKENPKITHKELNNQLSALTLKLHEYLTKIKTEYTGEINTNIKAKIYEPIALQDIAIGAKTQIDDLISERINIDVAFDIIHNYKQEVNMYSNLNATNIRTYIDGLQKQDNEIWDHLNYTNPILLPEHIMVVNFNYTNVADKYLPHYRNHFVLNYIHGYLESPQSIIFGYGDEMDKHYKELLESNDNEYLNNVKSIKYLEASNYRQLLQFAESAPYQIYIMGHSCGNSDRTLLNTLFEHENCVSIKPFYYKKEDGTDNYTEIVQNISRNFVDKKALRDRVVNKKLCEPLLKKTKKEKLSSVEYYCEALKNMKRTTIGGVKSPYKPLLMLSIIDLFNASTIENNKNADNQNLIIEITKYLENIFKNEWEEHPRSTYKFDYDIVNVLFYMQDEPFYALETLSEEINLYQRLLEIDKSFYYIKLDSDLIKLLTNSTTRQQLRDVLEEMLN